MLNASQLESIRFATTALEHSNFEEREKLFWRMDKIMDPVLDAARTSATEEQIEAWLQALPLGYYRQTLRVIINTRFHQPEGNAGPVGEFKVEEAPVVATGGYAAAINAAILEETS
jgi:hypothetical protein